MEHGGIERRVAGERRSSSAHSASRTHALSRRARSIDERRQALARDASPSYARLPRRAKCPFANHRRWLRRRRRAGRIRLARRPRTRAVVRRNDVCSHRRRPGLYAYSGVARMNPIRILLVDDQPLFREGLRTLLSVQPDFEVVGEAGNGAEALRLARSLRPAVVLMDLQMPVLDGVAATQRLCEEQPEGRVIVLTTVDDDELLFDGLRSGPIGR